MAEFHDRLAAVHGEIWEAGTAGTEALDRKLTALAGADLPEGVRRLPTACMRAGPHLGAQTDERASGVPGIGVQREGAAARRGTRAAR